MTQSLQQPREPQVTQEEPFLALPRTLKQHLESFRENMQVQRCADATMRHRVKALSRFYTFLEQLGIDDAREITNETIRAYQSWLLEQACSAFTVHAYTICLRRFFEHLEATDAIFLNPCVGLALPTLPDRLPRSVLTPDESSAILDAPDLNTQKGIRDRAILEVFYSTGIRCEEMAKLTVADVNCHDGMIHVTKGKFAKDRVVPVGSKACAALREYLERVRPEWNKTVPLNGTYLWLSAIQPHGPIKTQAVAVIARKYGILAGIEKSASPHVWRHSCATHLVSNGSDIAYVQQLLGHSSLVTTQRYVRVAIPEIRLTFRKKHPRARQGLVNDSAATVPGLRPNKRLKEANRL